MLNSRKIFGTIFSTDSGFQDISGVFGVCYILKPMDFPLAIHHFQNLKFPIFYCVVVG